MIFDSMIKDWNSFRLSQIANVTMGQSPSSSTYNTDKIGLPLIQGNADIKNYSTIKRIWTSKPTKIVEHNSIILTVRAPVGELAINEFNSCIGRGVCAIDSKYKRFLFYYFENFKKKWKKFEQGSTFSAINSQDIKKLKILLPPLHEQNRIVAVLESWDKAIDVLSKKIKIKKNIKKGLMQQLLTGKNKLANSENWQIVKLGEISIIKKGTSLSKKNIIPGDIPVIAGGKTSPYFHKTSNRDGVTITVSASGANAGYVKLHKQPIFASDCSTIQEKDVDLSYIYEYLKLKQKYIYHSLQFGGAQPHVYPKDLKILKIYIPTSLQEQKAIAQILTTADDEITALEKKKQLLEDQKKFLLNNLVTGKIRTPENLLKT